MTIVGASDGQTLPGFVVSEGQRPEDAHGRHGGPGVRGGEEQGEEAHEVAGVDDARGLVDELSQPQIQGLIAFLQAAPQ